MFTPNAYEELPMFRGVYLTSATQEVLHLAF
ncbi:type VI secretion protein IcmF/TssM N-terminal domain-containing protein [Pseudoalteromonas sp. B193]